MGGNIGEYNERLCMLQYRIYDYAAYEKKYDMQRFSELYLSSDFCNREMDSIYSVFHAEDATQCLSFLEMELGMKAGYTLDYISQNTVLDLTNKVSPPPL